MTRNVPNQMVAIADPAIADVTGHVRRARVETSARGAIELKAAGWRLATTRARLGARHVGQLHLNT